MKTANTDNYYTLVTVAPLRGEHWITHIRPVSGTVALCGVPLSHRQRPVTGSSQRRACQTCLRTLEAVAGRTAPVERQPLRRIGVVHRLADGTHAAELSCGHTARTNSRKRPTTARMRCPHCLPGPSDHLRPRRVR